ncbi:F0F1 ATP synthase subunit A [Spiroplasma taiwanense]|uniref:F0F1 ATP synthase subunit A n=1 Tax=Spiroplasma taiwanense CT-1 TaxID=1276220 RepID=S5MAG8_9MOLU|nr:F0F1 ATP synthase subunit A [Spiroplasma taiwanense]AGR40748.1 F0F1 ATP synthase subunit A [Spiroplasma taiwanense CT-1]
MNLLADSGQTGMFDSLYSVTPQLLSILVTFIIICTFCIVYNVKIRNFKEDKQLTGFLVLTEIFISKVENMVITIMGKKHRKLTPYVMYLFMYIAISSIISLLGIESLSTSYTVTFSMGFVTFLGVYYYGLRYQKLAFFRRYLNPIELIAQFVPLISISFRLFGNILGGSIILGLLYAALINFQGNIFDGNRTTTAWEDQYHYWWAGLNIFTVISMPVLHLYFDLFDGTIQSIVFSMLTLSYWSGAKNGESEDGEEKQQRWTKKDKKS